MQNTDWWSGAVTRRQAAWIVAALVAFTVLYTNVQATAQSEKISQQIGEVQGSIRTLIPLLRDEKGTGHAGK